MSSSPQGHRAPVQTIAITGASGGVGKTTVAVNLAIALSLSRCRVLLLDGAVGWGGVHNVLGSSPRCFLEDALLGKASMAEVVEAGPGGISVVAAGGARLASPSHNLNAGVIHAVSRFGTRYDFVVVDTSLGVFSSAMDFSAAASHVLNVQRDDPASISSSLRLISALAEEHHVRSFGVFVNQARSESSARKACQKLDALCERLVPEVVIRFWGWHYDDATIRHATRRQRPVVLSKPDSAAAERFRALGSIVRALPLRPRSAGRVEFFANQHFGADSPPPS